MTAPCKELKYSINEVQYSPVSQFATALGP